MSSNFSAARKVVFYIVVTLSTIVILASALSLINDIPRWYLKILDFPRLQQFVLAIILLIVFVFVNKKWKLGALALAIGLVSSMLIHASYMFPYVMGSEVVPSVSQSNNENTVSILLANVLIKNKDSQKLIDIVNDSEPDLILAMEVDSWWTGQLQSIEKSYPHILKEPLDNAYGMALYSKYPLSNTQIKYLNHSKVPSFIATVSLSSGKEFRFYGVHPVAPFPSDKYPDNIGEDLTGENQEKEVALLKVGDMVANEELPVIVGGDFNDVAWSNTSRLFGQDGNLKDVRIGRGLKNTFDAKSMIMRWPLDHFYVSEKIGVSKFERLPEFGSDHFPLLGEFVVE